MSTKCDAAQVWDLLRESVNDLNKQLRKAQRLDCSAETPLIGEGGRLDSLGLINLLVMAEQRIETEFGVSVMLADEDVLTKESNPFKNLGTLAEHIRVVVENKLNGL